jgi:alpha-1,6-mannosyltransferase
MPLTLALYVALGVLMISQPPRWGYEVGLFLLLGLLAWQWIRWQGQSMKPAWGWFLLITIAATLIPPFHSTDVYGYINRGWLQAGYGVNPYAVTVAEIPRWWADPMFTNHWVQNPSPYGFGFMHVARWLTQPPFWLSLVLFKALALLAHGLNTWLLGRVWGNPVKAILLFGLNPLVLLHGLTNAHNDMLLATSLIITLWAAQTGRLWAVLPALMLGILVKYAPVVLLPFVGLWLWRRDPLRGLVLGGALALAFAAVAAWPYLSDQIRWQAIEKNLFLTRGSLHAALYHSLKPLIADRQALFVGLKALVLGSYALFGGGLWLRRCRVTPYSYKSLQQDMAWGYGGLLLVAALKFYPWYLIALMPLLPWPWALPLTVGPLFGLTFLGQAHILNYLLLIVMPVFVCCWRNGWMTFSALPARTDNPISPGQQ